MQMFRAFAIAGFALLSAAAISASSARAQPTRSFEQSCKEVLRLSPQAFSDLFVKKTGDGSEAGLDQAANDWANCKYSANLVRLKAFPALKARLNNLDLYTGQFIGAETVLAYLADGGGTMFSHGAARFQPAIQLHFERLIGLTITKAGAVRSSAINVRYAAAKKNLEARLKRVQTPKPFVEGDTKNQAADKRKQWVKSVSDYGRAYQNIRKTIGSRSDATSVVVMEFLAQGLWAEEL